MLKIGTVTIGQTPRVDVVPEIEGLISGKVEIVEKGALDGLTPEQIKGFKPKKDSDTLVTRLRDGTEVTIGESYIIPRIQKIVSELENEDIDIITLLCSGEFPIIQSKKPLLMPHRLFAGVLSSIRIGGKLGVLVPSQRQVSGTIDTFNNRGFRTVALSTSPYASAGGIAEAARGFKGQVGLVFMNCFGYSLEMKRTLRALVGIPVILARSLLARALNELI
ncbi:MAG: AroM family protein [Candidatus Bipolaricaulota bacterium]|nr:AroM family protein [Candidatus Bipolaricaulota bacterium]